MKFKTLWVVLEAHIFVLIGICNHPSLTYFNSPIFIMKYVGYFIALELFGNWAHVKKMKNILLPYLANGKVSIVYTNCTKQIKFV